MRILVVEDQAVIAMSLVAELIDLQHRPIGPARSIAEALLLIEKHKKIDAAILDISLPDGNSHDLAEFLIARGVLVILATGKDEENRPPNLSQVPVLTKPFASEELQAVLAALPFES